jgi:magnesium-transporting ATPase (P-type)
MHSTLAVVSFCCAEHRQASRWSYSSDVAMSHDKKTRATVVQRYHFSSGLRRMSATVLLEEEDAPQQRPMALMKGAPEVVRQFLKQVGCRMAYCCVISVC